MQYRIQVADNRPPQSRDSKTVYGCLHSCYSSINKLCRGKYVCLQMFRITRCAISLQSYTESERWIFIHRQLSTTIVTSPIVVSKLKKGRVLWVYCPMGENILLGKAWRLFASTVRKQEIMNAMADLTCSSSFSPELQLIEWCQPHSR